ncbi:MAG: hypothetical protein K8S54_10400 [Spirochaetia bacterium]|nr:hypothetical protein [Spirochaetia bacterium]
MTDEPGKPTTLAESVWAVLHRRIVDPFLGTFLLALLTWNWKPVLTICFDDETMRTRIDSVITDYWGDDSSILKAVLIPLCVASAWYFAYPFVARLLAKFHDIQDLKTGKMRADLANERRFESELKNLQGKEQLLKRVEQAFFTLYRERSNPGQIGHLDVVYCPQASLGDWVRMESNSTLLAVARPREPIWANAVVVMDLKDGFCLVQGNGVVDPNIFAGEHRSIMQDSRKFILSSDPGKMERVKAAGYAQVLLRFEPGEKTELTIDLNTTHLPAPESA